MPSAFVSIWTSSRSGRLQAQAHQLAYQLIADNEDLAETFTQDPSAYSRFSGSSIVEHAVRGGIVGLAIAGLGALFALARNLLRRKS